MEAQYIDIFYAEDSDDPYQVFLFEGSLVIAQCNFKHLLPVAQFCRIQQLPVMSEFELIRLALLDYDIEIQPLAEKMSVA